MSSWSSCHYHSRRRRGIDRATTNSIYVTTGNEFIIFHFTNYTGRHKRIMFSVWTEQNGELLYCAVPCVSHVIERASHSSRLLLPPLARCLSYNRPFCVCLLSLARTGRPTVRFTCAALVPSDNDPGNTRLQTVFFLTLHGCTHANRVYAEKKKRWKKREKYFQSVRDGNFSKKFYDRSYFWRKEGVLRTS